MISCLNILFLHYDFHFLWSLRHAAIGIYIWTLTSEALTTFTGETVELVDAGAAVLTWVGQTIITVQIAVLARPARLTVTAIPAECKQEITPRLRFLLLACLTNNKLLKTSHTLAWSHYKWKLADTRWDLLCRLREHMGCCYTHLHESSSTARGNRQDTDSGSRSPRPRRCLRYGRGSTSTRPPPHYTLDLNGEKQKPSYLSFVS